jgi:hypothetical protein
MVITQLWKNDMQFSLKFALHPLDPTLVEGLCNFCSHAAKVAYSRNQSTNWNQLKTYFGLCDLEGCDWEASSGLSESEADAEELVDDR